MFTYLIGLYHRALHNQALTPKERAGLKAVQGAVIGFVTDMVYQLVPILARGGRLDFTQAGVMSLLLAFILALVKLWAAQSDPAIGAVLDAYSKEVEQQALHGITAEVIDGQAHVPAVHLIIPNAQPIASSGLLPVRPPVNTPNINASEIVQQEDRTQFITPSPAQHNMPPITDVDTIPVPAQKGSSYNA